MGLSVYPTPSSSSSQFSGAGTIAASTSTTKGYYTTTLAAGTYIVNVIVQNSYVSGQYPTNNNATAIATYSISSYANNKIVMNAPSNSPSVLKLTTSDTVWLGNSLLSDVAWYFELSNFMSNNVSRTSDRWRIKNHTDYTKVASIGRNGSGNPQFVQLQWENPWGLAVQGNQNYSGITISGSGEYIDVYTYLNNAWFLALNSNAMYRSTNGTTFSSVTLPSQDSPVFDFLYTTANSGNYVVVCASANTAKMIYNSTDGITWISRTAPNTTALYSITYGNGVYVATGTNGVIHSSTDSITWSNRTSPHAGGTYMNVIYNPTSNNFLAINDTASSVGQAAVSTNGVTWTAVAILRNAQNATLTGNDFLNSQIIFNINSCGRVNVIDGKYFAGYGTTFFMSTNGTTWGNFNIGYNNLNGFSTSWWYDTANSKIKGWGWNNTGQGTAYETLDANIVIYNSTI